ncbi:MAG: bifunctional diguanylate cyclase/phosphodiesterase [Thermodesulfobacteriota bacterium]
MGLAEKYQPDDNMVILAESLHLKAKKRHSLNLGTIQNLEMAWEGGRPLGLLLFSIHNFFAFERIYGEGMSGHALHVLQTGLRECGRQILNDSDLIYTENLEDGTYITIFRQNDLDLQTLADLATTFRLSIKREVNKEMVKLTGQQLEIRAGYARLRHRTEMDTASILFEALCDAQEVAAGAMNITKLRLMEEFRQIIELPRLTSVYMPIVDLRSSRVLGWEALARGPVESRFHLPSVLFDFAEEVGALFSLERVCREQALRGIGSLESDQKLFMNIHPHTVGDPNFTAGETRRLLMEYGLEPRNVIFEITERHPIRDFTLFFRTLEHYRSQGYQVAIDDVGAGYSGLWTLGQVRPEYVKIDMSLVRGVDSNPVNRALLETLVSFADKIGAAIIAEGIETETELSSLMDMGVHFGQGFFLARPDRPKPFPSRVLPVRPLKGAHQVSVGRCSIPIGELAEPAIQMGPEIKISEVQHMLESMPPSPISGVVVVKDGKPLGLVMSHDLNRQLGTLYGVALYYERPITRLMDPLPLIVEESLPVEVVAERAMSREKYKVYDHILVTRNSEMVGVVSVQKMLDTLARVHVEMAKGANPLTGLPGNVAIEQEIEARALAGQPTSLIYADLDNFKVFNDKYGFEAGDRMLLLLTRIIVWAVRRHEGREGFVGHVGGDDFVLMTSPERAERVCQAIVRCFGRCVPYLYDPGDRSRGCIEGKSRSGEPGRFPLTAVSLAIVDCFSKSDLMQFAMRAAEMKKYAKSQPGNVWVRDRRARFSLAAEQMVPLEQVVPAEQVVPLEQVVPAD